MADRDEEHNLHPKPDILMAIKIRTIRWARYVTSMEVRNAYIILVGKL
jgi:hypothetical protein